MNKTLDRKVLLLVTAEHLLLDQLSYIQLLRTLDMPPNQKKIYWKSLDLFDHKRQKQEGRQYLKERNITKWLLWVCSFLHDGKPQQVLYIAAKAWIENFSFTIWAINRIQVTTSWKVKRDLPEKTELQNSSPKCWVKTVPNSPSMVNV